MYRRILISLLLSSESTGFIIPELSRRRYDSISLSNSYWGEQEFDFDGFSERLRSAYEEWCQTYGGKFGSSRMEVFSYHFMVAENYSRRTGVKVKLNQFAGLTQPEIQQVMGEIADDIERPLGAEFLDYELEEEASSVLTSTETIDPPRDDHHGGDWFNGFRSDAGDKVAIATNAFMEEFDKDSIVPKTENNLFRDINESILEKESLSLDEIVNEEVSQEASIEETVHEDQIEETPADPLDENSLVFLSNLERLSREGGLADMDAALEDTTDQSKAPNMEENPMMDEPIQDVLIPEPVSDPGNVDHFQAMDPQTAGFNPEEAYFYAGQGSVDPNRDEKMKPKPPATPMAREAAKRANIDLSLIQGTGKDGRITLHDVEVARDAMNQSPEDVWQSYTAEERIRNGPFRQPSHGFYADSAPSVFDHGADMHDAPTGYGADEYASKSNDFSNQAPKEQDHDPSPEMFQQYQDAEVLQEDSNTHYNTHDDTSAHEQPFEAHERSEENQHSASKDELRPELQGPSTHFNPDVSHDFQGSAESPRRTASNKDSDSLDERIERAMNRDLDFVSRKAAQDLEEPQASPEGSVQEASTDVELKDGKDQVISTSRNLGLQDEFKEQSFDLTSDDLDGTIEHDGIIPPEAASKEGGPSVVSPKALDDFGNKDALKTELKSRKVQMADEEDSHQEDSQSSYEEGFEEEEIPTGWAEEEPEEEHFDLPAWVVGNAEPLAPHLSGSDRMKEQYPMEMVSSTKRDDDKSTTTGESLSHNLKSSKQPEKQKGLDQKPPEKRASRVASERNPGQSPTFLDAVTAEAVQGNQVQLPELTFWMSEAKIEKWCKKVGDPVHVGETLMVVVCDTKISKETLEWAPTQDVKATSNGFLLAKHFGAGDMISKGWTIGVIGTSREGLATVDPEPITGIEESSPATEDKTSKKPKNEAKSNPPQKNKKAKEATMSAKEEQSKSKNVHVEKSEPRSQTRNSEVPTVKQIHMQKIQEVTRKSGWKLSPSVDWEPKRVKMDSLNHILIPFLQTKIEAWERKSRFQLPASISLQQEVLSSSKNKMTIRWEPQRNGKKKKKPRRERSQRIQAQHCFANLPAVSWQFEKSQLPTGSMPLKAKRTRQIFFLEPKSGVPRQGRARKRLGAKVQWSSFPKLIKWENATHPLPPRRVPQKPEPIDEEEQDESALPEKMIYATPMARAAARMANLDLKHVSGTGVGGRITLDDVKDVLYPLLFKEQEEGQKQHRLSQQQGDDHRGSKSLKVHRETSSRPSTLKPRSIRTHSLKAQYASPMARKLANEHEIDLGTVMGSGPRGHILLEDVQQVIDRMNKATQS